MKTMQIDIITFIWRWISPLLFSWSVMSWLFSDPKDYSPPDSSVHGISQARINGVGCHFLLQGVFWIQGSNPCLLHCRQILYHLSHQGSLLMFYIKTKNKNVFNYLFLAPIRIFLILLGMRPFIIHLLLLYIRKYTRICC